MKRLTAAYVILVHIMLLVALRYTPLPSMLRQHLSGDSSPTQSPCYRTTARFYERMAPQIPDGAVLFIGDSMIQGLCTAAVTENGVGLGIGGDTTQGVTARIMNMAALHTAKAVVLGVGYNDIRNTSPMTFEVDYRRLLAVMPADQTIHSCGILPVAASNNDTGMLSSIQSYNTIIINACSALKNCIYVAPPAGLYTEQGFLKENLHGGDGLHLNHEGYALWIEALRESLEQRSSSTAARAPESVTQ